MPCHSHDYNFKWYTIGDIKDFSNDVKPKMLPLKRGKIHDE